MLFEYTCGKTRDKVMTLEELEQKCEKWIVDEVVNMNVGDNVCFNSGERHAKTVCVKRVK